MVPETDLPIVGTWREAEGLRRDVRFRVLREGAFIATLLDRAPMPRFWLSELRRLNLFLSLIQESSWMRGGEAGRFPCTTVAARSRMSLARLTQVLEMGCSTGDFTRQRDPRDARHYVFEPTEATIALFSRLTTAFHADAATLMGRPAPQLLAGSAAERQAQRSFLATAQRFLAKLELGDRGVGSLSFMLALLDLHLHRPIATTDFVRREAERLNVSCVTVRNLLRRAEERGWLCRDRRMLMLSGRGTNLVMNAMDEIEGVVEEFFEGGAATSAPVAMRGPARAVAWDRVPA